MFHQVRQGGGTGAEVCRLRVRLNCLALRRKWFSTRHFSFSLNRQLDHLGAPGNHNLSKFNQFFFGQ